MSKIKKLQLSGPSYCFLLSYLLILTVLSDFQSNQFFQNFGHFRLPRVGAKSPKFGQNHKNLKNQKIATQWTQLLLPFVLSTCINSFQVISRVIYFFRFLAIFDYPGQGQKSKIWSKSQNLKNQKIATQWTLVIASFCVIYLY